MKKLTTLIVLMYFCLPLWAQVTPIPLGRASNAFSAIRCQQNQISVNDSLNLIVFIHRQDVNIWGGGSQENGKFRYDISTDGGLSFTTDVGPLQTSYTNYGRFPQVDIYNPTGNSSLANANLVWMGSTDRYPTPGATGAVHGTSDASTTSPGTTETYSFSSATDVPIFDALTQSTSGRYFAVGYRGSGNLEGTGVAPTFKDTLNIYQGMYNSNTGQVDWSASVQNIRIPNANLNGNSLGTGANIAFSPNGNTGWIAGLGDAPGGNNNILSPYFLRSTDGGSTWGNPTEVDLNDFQHLVDSINLSVNISSGNAVGSGVVGTGRDFDLVVDANGNPHMLVVVGNSSNYQLEILPNATMWKAIVDITSTNGGATWQANILSPVFTVNGEFGSPDFNNGGAYLYMEHFCQAARSRDGNYLFFSWVDSDTTLIGYGEQTNFTPNLRIKAIRISDGYETCLKTITDGDVLWDGRALFPTMAPTVLSAEDTFKLPIVITELMTNDQLAPTQYHYLGNSTYFTKADFNAPAAVGWQYLYGCFLSCTNASSAPTETINEGDSILFAGSYLTESGIYFDTIALPTGCDSLVELNLTVLTSMGDLPGKTMLQLYPNPTTGSIHLVLPAQPKASSFKVFNMVGQVVYSTTFEQSSTTLHLQLGPGVYLYQVVLDDGQQFGKLIVE